MTMFPGVMPPAQQGVLRQLGPFATRNRFYLAGGTAVAIRIGHRRSVDLDWFTGERIPEPFRLGEELRRAEIEITVDGVEVGTLHGELGGVRLSFLEYRYPLLHPAEYWPEYGCDVAALEDLACMKLSAIASRGAKKDFVDLYALGKSVDLASMLDWYQQKFQVRDIGHVLFSLVYFDDAEPDDMPEMLWSIGWEDMKFTIEGWVNDYTLGNRGPGPI